MTLLAHTTYADACIESLRIVLGTLRHHESCRHRADTVGTILDSFHYNVEESSAACTH
jgi:hypothetical protein